VAGNTDPPPVGPVVFEPGYVELGHVNLLLPNINLRPG
jgi:hypothetical protein